MNATRMGEAMERDLVQAVRAAKSLDELAAALNTVQPGQGELTQAEEHLMTSLPTFGGDEIGDTHNVWSWDATRVLVQMSDGFRCVPRSERAR